MFDRNGLPGRIAYAVFYGVVVFVVVFIIGIFFTLVPQLVEVGNFLKTWAAVLGVLAGIASFFTGQRP